MAFNHCQNASFIFNTQVSFSTAKFHNSTYKFYFQHSSFIFTIQHLFSTFKFWFELHTWLSRLCHTKLSPDSMTYLQESNTEMLWLVQDIQMLWYDWCKTHTLRQQSDCCEMHTPMWQSDWCSIHTLMKQSDWCKILPLMRETDWCKQNTTPHTNIELFFYLFLLDNSKMTLVGITCLCFLMRYS